MLFSKSLITDIIGKMTSLHFFVEKLFVLVYCKPIGPYLCVQATLSAIQQLFFQTQEINFKYQRD